MPTLIVYERDGRIRLVRRINAAHSANHLTDDLYDEFKERKDDLRSILIDDELGENHRVVESDGHLAIVRADEKRLGVLRPLDALLAPRMRIDPRPVFSPPPPQEVNLALWRGITVVVAISGRWHCLASLLRFLRDCDLPDVPVMLYINDNSQNDQMGDLLRRFLAGPGKRFAGTTYIRDWADHRPGVAAGIRTATIYQRAIDSCLSKTLLTLEDDVIPPLNAIPLMYKALVDAPQNVVAVGANVPCRHGQGKTMCWNFPEGEDLHECERGDEIEGVSFSCTLHQTKALRSLGLVESIPQLMGQTLTDIALWVRLKEFKLRPLFLWDLVCDHLDADFGWVGGKKQNRAADASVDAEKIIHNGIRRLAHFYHIYAIHGWERITTEHIEALKKSGLAEQIGCLHIGVVGNPDDRDAVASFCAKRIPTRVVAESDTGWEQVTLAALKQDPIGDAVLYCHTKGITEPTAWNDSWRRSMTAAVVGDWRRCVELMKGHESIGCHWLTKQQYPSIEIPIWGGNFWWARRDLIDRLKPVGMGNRHEAEAWLGRNEQIDVFDLAPGWPGQGTLYKGNG